MCKLNNIKNKQFIIYRLVKDNYVGVTTNLHKRLLKHKSKSNFNINEIEILEVHSRLDTALIAELAYQKTFNCNIGVRNQCGKKNPYAKQVLELSTGIYFDTIKEACESFNYDYSLVRKLIKDKNNKFLIVKI